MKKILLLPLFLLVCLVVQSQDKTFNFTFDHYAINVSNLDNSVSFYQKYLFVKEIYDGTEKENIRWFSLGNNQELHIISVENLKKDLPKGVHLALTTEDLDSYIDFLKENKIEYFDWPGASMSVSTRPDKIQQIYIQDPDGYWIEINNGITRYTKK